MKKPKDGLRVNVTSKNFLYVMCVTSKVESVNDFSVFQSDYEAIWNSDSEELPIIKRTLVMKIVSRVRSFAAAKKKTERRVDFRLSKRHPHLIRMKIDDCTD